jgi:predicted dehydrogenase
MATVKYGVIGAGSIAQFRHIPEIYKNPNSEVVAIVDINKDRCNMVCEKYGAKPYYDYKKMLAEEKLDAVVVATPNYLHAQQTIDSLKAGCHVLVEKPMATTRADAKKMIATAKAKRKHLMIGMNQRLMPPHVKAKEILETGKLGKVLSFETTFKHGGPDGWSQDGAASWFFIKNKAVMGVTGDLGVHKADLMRYLLGEEFVEVTGFIGTLDKVNDKGKMINIDDNAYIAMKSQSGTLGTMTISWTNYGRMEDNGTTLYCENGVMLISRDPEFGVKVLYKNGQQDFHKVGKVATNTEQVGSGVSDMFTECILTRKKPSIDGMEGYRAIDIIISSMESAATGKAKKISLR